jgi:hypothetical protein
VTDSLPQEGSSLTNGEPSDDSNNDPNTDNNGNGNALMTQRLSLSPQSAKVDLLLIVDNSGSMSDDSLELADKLEGFVTALEDLEIDWQMCLTTTKISSNKAAVKNWVGLSGDRKWILNRQAAHFGEKIINTIEEMAFGGDSTGDERGIAALSLHYDQRSENGCYREGAAFSAILISDEDERSVGGNEALNDRQYEPLQSIDLPDKYLQKISGKIVRMTFNSLIVKPGDQACYDLQNAQEHSTAHYGTLYKELSQKTNGVVGSICSENYATELGQFATAIQQSLTRIRLQCVPVEGSLKVVVTGQTTERWQLQGQEILIDQIGSSATNWEMTYKCP